VAVGIVVLGGFVMKSRAQENLENLDRRISSLEEQVRLNAELVARSESVDRFYSKIAEQHSVLWTDEEIHDRLRREIYRLAMQDYYPPGSDVVIPDDAPRLVHIKSLRAGYLLDGDGYREYQLSFKPLPTDLKSLITFLARLQTSPQTLRIDALDISRPPTRKEVSATIAVTRTVVDAGEGAAEAGDEAGAEGALAPNLVENGGFEVWNPVTEGFDGWQAEGVALAQDVDHAREGDYCMKAVLNADTGAIYQECTVEAGKTYQVAADISAEGDVSVAPFTVDGAPLARLEPAAIEENGAVRYRWLVTVPGEAGQMAALRAPILELAGAGTTVYVDNVSVRLYGG